MKIVGMIFGGMVILVGILLLLLFSSIGNGIVQGIVESKINEKAPDLKARFETFSFGFSSLEIDLRAVGDTKVTVQGGYSLFSQSVDLAYGVDIKDLSAFEPLTKQKLQGPFRTNGTVKGGAAFIAVQGKSDVADSQTSYLAELTNQEPTKVIAKIVGAKLEKLLYLGGQPEFAQAVINLDADFSDLTPEKATGTAKLAVQNGVVNHALFAEKLGVKLPATTFRVDLDAKAHAPKAEYDLKINSNLAQIASNGNLDIPTQGMDIAYLVDVAELAVFTPIVGTELHGPVMTKGTVKGTPQSPTISGISDLAGSETVYQAKIVDSKPQSAKVKVDHLKLDKLLYMVNQPLYASADVNLVANMTGLDPKSLDGTVNLQVDNGVLNAPVVSEIAKMEIPKTNFTLKSDVKMDDSVAKAETIFDSTLAKLQLSETEANINTQALKSLYQLDVPDLDKLYFATQQHMKGAFSVNGKVEKKEDLLATAHSEFLDGVIDVVFKDDKEPFGDGKAAIKLDGIQVMAATDLLLKPRVFKAKLDGDLNYDLATQQGTLAATLDDGHILHNKMTRMLMSATGVDLTKEVYVNSKLNSNINKNLITSDLEMKSNLTSIQTHGAKVDTEKQQVDARIDLGVKDSIIGIKIAGKLDSPSIKLDVKDFLKQKATGALKEQLQKQFAPKGTGESGGKAQEKPDVGGLIKGLFGN